jgi:uncharacterized membrane protein YozB (DUF420 family)
MSTVTPSDLEPWNHTAHRAATTRRFYQGMAIAFLIAVFAGFARTYFLKPLTGWPPAPAIVHWHAALFTGWMLVFLAQAGLIARGRVIWHRRLGAAAVCLAVAMVAVGLSMTVDSARQGFVGVFPLPPGVPKDPLAYAVQGFFDLALFMAFFVAAIICRNRPDAHRRFMLLATISILPPAVVRIPLPGVSRLLFALALMIAFVAAQAIHDYVTRRRLHPVSVWGGLVLLATLPLRDVVGRSEPWHTFMEWLIAD